MGTGPHVAILMAVYQGRDYLPAQLESLSGQSHRGWSLIAGDDGSTATVMLARDLDARGR